MTTPHDSGALAIDRRATVRRITLDDTSWVDVIDGFVHGAGEQFAALHDGVHWQQGEVLRYDRYVPERRLVAGVDSNSTPLLRQTDLHLAATYRQLNRKFSESERSAAGLPSESTNPEHQPANSPGRHHREMLRTDAGAAAERA